MSARPRHSTPKHAYRDAARGPRLHKALADLGAGSRRACERLIEEGRVAVNGAIIDTSPAWVDPTADRIEVDGHCLTRRGSRAGRTYLMVNKPRAVICTNADPEGRRRIIDLVPHTQRLFCVGRLDADSSGLVLLTDDGDLAHRLTHPSFGVDKTYEVTIKGALTPEQIEKLQRGILLTDRRSPGATRVARSRAAGVEIVRRDREKTSLRITLREGRNREIRRMLARQGHRVNRLRRIGIGPLKLKGVASGQWRALTRPELSAIRAAARRAGKATAAKKKDKTRATR
ncbi:MAG: rRNA pseudouridine synthase [Phycisphaerae bacterium]|nr:rRNA pseudouridine synthase [Phycisphaerae bacterium]